MRFWISKNSEVPVHQQLTTQILLGIASEQLRPEAKLPSTRELARRLRIHWNTINAAYRDLAARGWLEFRKGSGYYVRRLDGDPALDADFELDELISTFLTRARDRGFSLAEIRSRVKRWLQLQPPDHFLLVEPDLELRRVLQVEISQATQFPVKAVGFKPSLTSRSLLGAVPVALYGRSDVVRGALPPEVFCIWLRSTSVEESLLKEVRRLPADASVAVASRWQDFLRWVRTVLVAAGSDPGRLSFYDARQAGWQKGLRAAQLVMADTYLHQKLPRGCRSLRVPLLQESSLLELQQFVKNFLGK